MKTYREFYKDITGFYPYHYQEKVAELLLEKEKISREEFESCFADKEV